MEQGGRNNSGRGAGGAGNRGHGRRGGGGRGEYQNQNSGGRGWNAPQRGGFHHQQQQQWMNRQLVQGQSGYDHAPPSQQARHQGSGSGAGRARGSTPQPIVSPVQHQAPRTQRSPSDDLNIQSLNISPPLPPLSSSSENTESQCQLIKRPDQGGKLSIRSINLLVNHFPVEFDPDRTIFHYDVDIKPVATTDSKFPKKPLRKSDSRLIRDKLFTDDPARFPLLKTAYDGEKNIFSAVSLPTGQFKVEIPDGEDLKPGSYTLTIKFVNELKFSKLRDYFNGHLSHYPREILQSMDLVMKENPSRHRMCIGRSFYSADYKRDDDLANGVAAYKGFQHGLKPTLQGLALCLDYSVLTFRKPLPVIDFLIEHILNFKEANDVKRLRRDVSAALEGLKVRVIHRLTKQKYLISGLAREDTRDTYFDVVDPEGNNPPQRVSLVTYFRDKWGRDIKYQNIPCLEVGKGGKSNKVPMEFCVLVEGQRYPKESLDKDRGIFLKNLTLAKPWVRRNTINEMLQGEDGPCGAVTRNFGIGVEENMTRVVGRVIGAPDLKLGGSDSVKVDRDKCQWNLIGRRTLLDGKSLDRWALIDFTLNDRYNKLQTTAFVDSLKSRCRSLGIRTEDPIWHQLAHMNEFSEVNGLEKLLQYVVLESRKINKGKLQLIVCVMTRRDPGYKFLKWVSETRIGVLTQCCLSTHANKGQDQYLANLCLKINAKLGGSNFELVGKLPHFLAEDRVLFIGADVNHPAPNNKACPSIAAVVGSVNWPGANRYAARVTAQKHRQEKIADFGSVCLDLVNTYTRLNNFRPNKIIVFRDGVSDSQFEMVLTQELIDLKKAIYDDAYQPKITLIVAQKRHQTRLFVENRNDMGASGNVPPGTVVDTKIVHPFDFDFYLCSHYGSLGTSKPTHYYVLWDENCFTSDELQKLIYDMCFTFARCTKPVSLVPPIYYADLVAYRGRMFQEAAMGDRFGASSSASNSSSDSSATFDPSFYRLHSDVENVMFFV